MNQGERQGCLTAILRFIGISLGGSEKARELPYRQRDDFLSAAELSFYRVLSAAIGNRAVICPKVNLADIFFVARPNENQSFRNKIDRKHVDFLLCDPATMRPLCGMELDDSSHSRRDRQDRDEFVNRAFEVAGLPLVRVPAKATYNSAGLLEMIGPHLSGKPISRTTAPSANTGTPGCPKCGVPMVERVAKTGQNAGKSFWGCRNYPKCKEIVQIN